MSNSNLFDTFKEAIEGATMKWTEYKQRENAYKGKVNEGLVELERLINKLKACIEKLTALEGDYADYITRITRIREGMQMMLNDQIGQIQHNTGKDCDKKIKDLLERFQVFVSQIKGWEGDANRFAVLLKALDDEIKRLCDEADKIVTEDKNNRTSLDKELRKVEERLNPGGSSSKEEDDIRESKEGETSVLAQVRAVERGDISQSQEIARARGSSQQSPRERAAEERAIARQEEARRRSSSETVRLPGYDQGGGWRSPNELKSRPYGTPVRNVNIKYNKTKNKKKKKKKKRDTRKKKKKQSRRRRRKGKKGKKGKRY